MANYQDMLRQVLKNLPAEERIAFLQETLLSLSHKERQTILQTIPGSNRQARISQSVPPKVVAAQQPPVRQVEKRQPDLAVSKPMPSGSSVPEKTSPTEAKPMNDAERQAVIDAKFKMFQAETQSKPNTAAAMRKQLLSCFGLGFLALALLIGLSIGGKELWDYLMNLNQ